MYVTVNGTVGEQTVVWKDNIKIIQTFEFLNLNKLPIKRQHCKFQNQRC
jgi:hypothetical protein